MKNWTIGKRIFVGFASLIAITLALGGFAYNRFTSVRHLSTSIVEDNMPGVYLMGQAQARARQIWALMFKHIGLDDKAQMEGVETEIRDATAKLDKVFTDYDKTIVQERDRELFKRIAPLRQKYSDFRNQNVLPLSIAGKTQEALKIANTALEPLYQEYVKSIDDLSEYNKQAGDQSGAAIQANIKQAAKGIVAGIIAALCVGIGIALVIIKSTSKALSNLATTLSDGSAQVASAASQVSSASQSLAEGASEQAASLEETSASLEEMSSMTKRNSENAENAKALANQTRAAADSGAGDMTQMSAAMGAIKTSSDNIAKIIKTIDEIAFQTNILALNAAVEAARAGEAGMGFAVVADEVRNLAQRSALAAKETAEKIEDSIRKSEQGVQFSAKVATSLGEIVEKARKVDDLVAEIANASREQSQGISQVNTAMTQMDKVTQSNAASAEESASAAEELNAQAATVNDAVDELVALVGGKASEKPQPKRTARATAPEHNKAPAGAAKPEKSAPARRIKATNGHAPVVKIAHDELPMDRDFKDF